MLRRRSSRTPSRPARRRVIAGLALAVVFCVAADGAARAETRVLNLLIDAEGLQPLHETQEDGAPVMWLPQLRMFDGEGRPFWSRSRMPPSRRDLRREIEEKVAGREPLEEGRTLRQEARYFLRRGGLPFNLTTLPPAELTVVEYWTDGCGQCEDLRKELDRFFDKADLPSVLVIRVFVDLKKYS